MSLEFESRLQFSKYEQRHIHFILKIEIRMVDEVELCLSNRHVQKRFHYCPWPLFPLVSQVKLDFGKGNVQSYEYNAH